MTCVLKASVLRPLLLFAAVLLIMAQVPGPAWAQAGPLRRVMQTLARKFGAELAEEGTEQTGKRLARVLARHGEDLAPVLEELGPRAVRLADELPEGAVAIMRRNGRTGVSILEQHGDEAISLFRRHGDDAIKLLAAHPGVGPSLVRTIGEEAVPALSRLSRPEAIRLAKMAGDVSKLPPEARKTFLERLAQGGDDFVAWVWRRKKEIFGSAALAGAVLNTYKLGDGLATAVPGMVPQPSPPLDSFAHPWIALFDRWVLPGLVVLGLTLLGAIRLSHRRSTRAAEHKSGHAGPDQPRSKTNHTSEARQP
jgi:hypothetical protein